MSKPRKRSKLVGAPQPPSFGVQLQRALQPMIRRVRATLPSVQTPAQARALKSALRSAFPDAALRRQIERVGRQAETFADRPWQQLLGRGDARRKEYNGRKLVEQWSKDATKLITSLRDEVAEGVRKDLVAALERGQDPADLVRKWTRQGIPVEWGTLEGRVKTIARHQLSMLHSRVQKTRAEALGIKSFVWRTQEDDRVRDAHEALNGRVFDYDDPPAEGLPGEPINCRCYAESIVEDLGEFGVEGTL